MTNESPCNVYDRGGVAIKHWCSSVNGQPIYYPVPFGGNLEKLLTAFQDFVPREDDVWICGYPKSGNHWMHETVSILLSGKAEPYNRMMIHSFVDIWPNLSRFENGPSPRVFHTHLSYHRLPPAVQQASKIICIMRNPKSTAVSHYHHMKKSVHTQYKGEFHNFWPVYINGITPGYLYEDWFTYHKTYWAAAEVHDNIMIVFYEDLIHDQLKQLCRISNFLGLDRSSDFHTKVMQLTTKNVLLENWSRKHPDDLKLTHKMDGSLIFRNGVIDDWKQHFTVEDNERFDKLYSEKMADTCDLASRIVFQ